MSNWTSILVATDFSDPARLAADRAARLAQVTGAQLTLMHVVSSGRLQSLRDWLGEGPAVERDLHEQAREQLGEWAQDLQQRHGVQPVTVHTLGTVVEDLLIEASSRSADVVVVGARGGSTLRRLVIGTTADRLLRRSTRPVLVVRHDVERAYGKVLVALDLGPGCERLIDLARRAAPEAALILFHAFEVPFESKLRRAGVDAPTVDRYRREAESAAYQGLRRAASDAGLSAAQWQPCVVEGDAWMQLVQQEQAQGIDLVVMAKHGQSLAEDLLLGSVTNHVLGEGEADVLVNPPLVAVPAAPAA